MNIALAGAGFIASIHGIAARAVPGMAVSHVASRSDERARVLAERLGAQACTYDELPAGAAAVVIATPPGQHASQALAAAAAGAAALIDKPLCRTLAEADELVAAERAGALLAYGENLVHAPPVIEAVHAARTIGALRHVEVRSLQDRPTWGDFLTDDWGGGVLFDLGPHPIAVALLLAGDDRVVEVEAALDGADDHGTDEHAVAVLRFASGLEARVEASWRSNVHLWDAQASSDSGVVRLELIPEPRLERNGEPVALPAPRTDDASALDDLGYVRQLETLAADVAQRRTPVCGAAFGRAVLEIICAGYASARTGDAEPLPFRGARERTPLELWRGD